MDFITRPLHNKSNTTLLGRHVKGVGLDWLFCFGLLIILFECFKMKMKEFLNTIKCSGNFNSKCPVKSSKYNSGTTLYHPRIKAHLYCRYKTISPRFLHTWGFRIFLGGWFPTLCSYNPFSVGLNFFALNIPPSFQWGPTSRN